MVAVRAFPSSTLSVAAAFRRDALEILAVVRLAVEKLRQLEQLLRIDEALAEGDLLDAADLLAGAFLQRAHEFLGLDQRIMRAGVEPGIAAAEPLDGELAGFEIGRVEVG